MFVLLIRPSSEKSRPPGGVEDVANLWGPPVTRSCSHPLFRGDSCFFSQRRLGQDLSTSHSGSVDSSTSDMPTSTAMMEVSESLLSGGWCSLLAMMWLSSPA